ncbi:MAG: DEAD/DEAH box helicase, partial [Verrucomicrobiae bacterium]|nr:DEAD/DEAH box helicase [Verrucomicrobiae bacterium]
ILGREKPKAQPRRPMALVLAPTRELAVQIGASFADYGKHIPFRQTLVYGGVGQGKQVQALARGVHLVVATPGRLLDLLEQGHIQFCSLEVLVLDEVDRMLDMGFWPDLQRLIKHMPKQRQSLFFSATLPPRIKELSRTLLYRPVNVSVSPDSPVVDRIAQSVVFVENGGKQKLLHEVLNGDDVDQALVFTKTKRGA